MVEKDPQQHIPSSLEVQRLTLWRMSLSNLQWLLVCGGIKKWPK